MEDDLNSEIYSLPLLFSSDETADHADVVLMVYTSFAAFIYDFA